MALDHAKPEGIVKLEPVGSAAGATKSHALVKTGDFEAVRLVVPAGAEIPPHAVPGMLTLQCLDGIVELVATKTTRMERGDWLYLEGGMVHSLRGVEDSTLLLTIVLKGSGS